MHRHLGQGDPLLPEGTADPQKFHPRASLMGSPPQGADWPVCYTLFLQLPYAGLCCLNTSFRPHCSHPRPVSSPALDRQTRE